MFVKYRNPAQLSIYLLALLVPCSFAFSYYYPTFSPNKKTSNIINSSNLAIESTVRRNLSADAIKSWRLFGHYQPMNLATSEDVHSETSLEIKLTGLFSSNSNDRWAIASISGSSEHLLKEGDSINENVKVYRINDTGIIITNRGVLETVPIQDFNKGEKAIFKAKKRDTQDKSHDEISGLVKALESAGLKRVSGEAPSGYVVISEEKRVNKFGLEKGDIINTVNGYPVGSDSADRLAFETYQRSGSASIEISRDGDIFQIHYPP